MSDKCFIPGGHGHADSEDLAYPLQTSETEGNPTNPTSTRAANSDDLLSCPYVFPTINKPYCMPSACNHNSKPEPRQKQDQHRHPGHLLQGNCPLGGLAPSWSAHTCRCLLDFQKQVRKTRNCIFSHDTSSTTSYIGLLFGGEGAPAREDRLVTWIRKLCGCPAS